MTVHHTQAPSRAIEAAQHDKATLGKPAKAKGYAVDVSHGHKSPDASGPSPMDPTVRGKHQPPCLVHPGMTRQQVGAAIFNGDDVLKEGVTAKR